MLKTVGSPTIKKKIAETIFKVKKIQKRVITTNVDNDTITVDDEAKTMTKDRNGLTTKNRPATETADKVNKNLGKRFTSSSSLTNIKKDERPTTAV